MTRLEHVGVAVDDVAGTLRILYDLLGEEAYKAETIPADNLRTHFISAGGVKLELLESLSDDSPVGAYLRKRGPGLHHLAFEVDDIDAVFRRVQELGFEPVDAAPRAGADGKRIFFLHPRQTGRVLIEFCQQTDSRLAHQDILDASRGRRCRMSDGSNSRRPLVHLHRGHPQIDPESLAFEITPLRPFYTLDVGSSAALTEHVASLDCGPYHVLLDLGSLHALRIDDERTRSIIVVDPFDWPDRSLAPRRLDVLALLSSSGDALDRARTLRSLDQPPQLAIVDDPALRSAVIGRFLSARG